jgi:hypothetical protein
LEAIEPRLNPFLLFDLIPLFVLTLIDCGNRMGNAILESLGMGSEPGRIPMELGSQRLLDFLEPDRTLLLCVYISPRANRQKSISPGFTEFRTKNEFSDLQLFRIARKAELFA